MARHIHADLIHAWADGSEIQWQEEDGTWHDVENPTWGLSCAYRIKPRIVKRGGVRTDRELLADALHALELWSRIDAKDLVITQEIRARLADPEDEPAAWLHSDESVDMLPLYLRPHQPALLTDEEIGTLYGKSMNVIMSIGVSKSTFTRIVRKAEEKILSKNFDK